MSNRNDKNEIKTSDFNNETYQLNGFFQTFGQRVSSNRETIHNSNDHNSSRKEPDFEADEKQIDNINKKNCICCSIF